jgi:hypothetical protein
LITCMPKMENREKWCRQQRGHRSQITGMIRV